MIRIFIPITEEQSKKLKADKKTVKLVSTIETSEGKLMDAVEVELPEMDKKGMQKAAENYLNKNHYVRERLFIGEVYVDGMKVYSKLIEDGLKELFK